MNDDRQPVGFSFLCVKASGKILENYSLFVFWVGLKHHDNVAAY